MKRYCSNCGTLFETNAATQRFCGSVCAKASTPKGHFIILERDGFQCIYCGRSPYLDRTQLAVDHILPVSEGGDDRAINLATCCRTCNLQKADRVFKEHLQRQLFAAIHTRNEEAGIDDNQRIDLGSSSAATRNDIEGKTLPELYQITEMAKLGKEDPINGLLAAFQMARIAAAGTLKIAASENNQELLRAAENFLDRSSLIMAEVENRRYETENTSPQYIESLFDMYGVVAGFRELDESGT